MSVTEDVKLVAGQPIKYRYSGHTEKGAISNKTLGNMMIAREAVIEYLRDKPEEFLRTYQGSSPEVHHFLGAVVSSWAMNENDNVIRWYRQSSPKTRLFLKKLGFKVGVQDITKVRPLGEPPADLFLPARVWGKIHKNSRRIDEDKGVPEFTYGIIGAVHPNGYKEAKNFRLDERLDSWNEFSGLVLSDPTYAYEIIPITSKDLLGGLQAEIETYEPRIAPGGSQGAIEARKQFLLQQVSLKLEKASSPKRILEVMCSDNRIPAPETGVYVLLRDTFGI